MCARPGGTGWGSPKASVSHADAIRHGWRIAAAAPRHPHRPQPAGALKAPQVCDQELAAPDGAVWPVPGAVEDRSHCGPISGTVLGQAGCEVGVVVLDADRPHALAFQRVPRREVVGVQVVHDDFGRDREQALEVLDALLKGPQRRVLLEVADVMPDPRALTAGQAERVLLLGPAGQQRGAGGLGQQQVSGHVSTRSA